MTQPESNAAGVRHVVHRFTKNGHEEVQVAVSTFQGRRYVDLRVYFREKGHWQGTHKGITVRADLLLQLEEAMRRLGATRGVPAL